MRWRRFFEELIKKKQQQQQQQGEKKTGTNQKFYFENPFEMSGNYPNTLEQDVLFLKL